MSDVATTPRIAPIENPGPEAAEELALGPQINGRPMNVFGTIAHDPGVLQALNGLGATLQRSSPFTAREREIVILRTAGHAANGYEIHHHRALGAAAGMTGEELDAAVDPGSSHAWTASEAVLVRVADELCLTADVSDEAYAALAAERDATACISLFALVGFFRLVGGLLNGARVQLESD